MSDSDDTDVLLLIPPDLFLVPSSSDSDVSSGRPTGVISELVEHMQSLESRISAIESKDNSLETSLHNNSLESHACSSLRVSKSRHALARNRFSVSQASSLQSTPVKPRKSLSVPSTPNGCSKSNTNSWREDRLPVVHTNRVDTNSRDKHEDLVTDAEPVECSATELLHAAASCKGSCRSWPGENACDKPCNRSSMLSGSNLHSMQSTRHTCSEIIQKMELSEVDELLQEMEATELELSKRINQLPGDVGGHQQELARRHTGSNRKLEFQHDSRSQCNDTVSSVSQKYTDVFPDISLPCTDSFQLDEPDKLISDFKVWEQSMRQSFPQSREQTFKDIDVKKPANESNALETAGIDEPNVGASTVQTQEPSSVVTTVETVRPINGLAKADTALYVKNVQQHLEQLSDIPRTPQYKCNILDNEKRDASAIKYISSSADINPQLRKSQRLLSLSDFWDTNNTNKSQEELLRIKLEEERFRREHCEHLIQELQKRLLEQQEKVAVAIRVDNEKNSLISQFHSAWSKLKQRVQVLEREYESLQTNCRNETDKHQSEISEFQAQIKRCENELSKALDLAAGYKEKSDNTIKEKVELLRSHADELENYKSLVQEAENRYEQMKGEYNKLLEKNRQTEETLKNVQQELNKERLRGGEVRNEMAVIHKALDACEAELTVLRQEKENLQLKIREETNRNAILEQKNSSLLASIEDAKKAEKLAKDENKSLAEQREKIKTELQEVYQKQVDEVVKAKLQEFQAQLDTAESEFLEELKTRQQVIAECAARKIKDVIDKHRLEINLLEEKHKEEKRLCELQLAQVVQKSFMLEAQLNSQRTTKSQLAEQLHSVMQKQWQQALQIISGGNMENLSPLQRLNVEKVFESKGPKKSESMPNCSTKVSQDPMKLSRLTESRNLAGSHSREEQNESLITLTSTDETPLTSRKESKDDLRKYIKMIAEMQQAREEFPKFREKISSSPPACRELPRKHYMKKELSIMSEDSVTWQPVEELSAHDVTEYIPTSQKLFSKTDQQRTKPPWK